MKSNKGVSSEICSLYSWEASAGSRTSGLLDGADLFQHQQHLRKGSATTAHTCSTIVDCCDGWRDWVWFEDAGRRNLKRGGRPGKEKWIAIGKL